MKAGCMNLWIFSYSTSAFRHIRFVVKQTKLIPVFLIYLLRLFWICFESNQDKSTLVFCKQLSLAANMIDRNTKLRSFFREYCLETTGHHVVRCCPPKSQLNSSCKKSAKLIEMQNTKLKPYLVLISTWNTQFLFHVLALTPGSATLGCFKLCFYYYHCFKTGCAKKVIKCIIQAK